MNKYLLTAIIYLLVIITSFGQELRKINDYEGNPEIEEIYYNSDSLIYGYDGNFGQHLHYYFNGKKWNLLDLKGGFIFTSPGSRVYFLNTTSLSIINPITQKVEKSYPLKLNILPYYYPFEVYNDSFFIAQDSNSTYYKGDSTYYKYVFDENKITKKKLLKGIIPRGFKLVEDSILYFYDYKGLYKKNLKTGVLSTLLTTGRYIEFDCFKNILVYKDYPNLYISDDYGQSFKQISILKYPDMGPFHITGQDIYFTYNNAERLVIIDFYANEKYSGDLKINTFIYHGSYKCDKKDGGGNTWLNDTNWIIASTIFGIYKFDPKVNSIKYLGGSFNTGVAELSLNYKGNLALVETENGLWGFSSDSGKTWKIPKQFMHNIVKRIEFKDSIVFILYNKKLYKYNFEINKFDTALVSAFLNIKDFSIFDNLSLLLFTNFGVYNYNLKTNALIMLGSLTPFENYSYLKKSNRILAIGGYDIYYSDDFGKSWIKSVITGYDFFHTLAFEISLEPKETSKDELFFKISFNDSTALLYSNDGGKTFYLRKDNYIRNSLSTFQLYRDLYWLNNDGRVLKFDINFELEEVAHYYNGCPATKMQVADSGFFIWNSRAQIYYQKVPYQMRYTFGDNINVFPNPVHSNSVLNIVATRDMIGRVYAIEMYDMIGKKQEQVNYYYSAEQNIYEVKNLPNKSAQFYVLVIKIKGGVSYRQKVFIY